MSERVFSGKNFAEFLLIRNLCSYILRSIAFEWSEAVIMKLKWFMHKLLNTLVQGLLGYQQLHLKIY
jgi:hypothetical protein